MGYILFFIGLVLLVKGAQCLVEGASSLADRAGISRLVIGLTIVSLGTTMPELVVSLFAAARSQEEILFGNLIGSGIANILLVLGLMALLIRLKVRYSTTWKEIPFAFLAVLVLLVLAARPLLDGHAVAVVLRTDGMVLLLFFVIFLYYVFELARRSRAAAAAPDIRSRSRSRIAALLTVGSAGLYVGGGWTVNGAGLLAGALGLSEFLISAIVIAVGTSLPELITALVAIKKKNVDLAVGNLIGSNIFNIFWVLGLSAVVRPLEVPGFIWPDILILLLATFALFIFMFTSKRHELDRWEGVLFLLAYAAYIAFLIVRG